MLIIYIYIIYSVCYLLLYIFAPCILCFSLSVSLFDFISMVQYVPSHAITGHSYPSVVVCKSQG